MANETEISNAAKPTNVVSDAISAALVQAVVCVPHVYAEDLPVGTNVKLFRKDGSLTAEAVSESATYNFSASSELTQSTITATAVKTAVVSKLTVEAQQFTSIDMNKIAMEQGKAIARKLDDDVLALFDGLTNVVTATNVLTVADIMQGAYTVRSALAGGIGRRLIGIFDYKGIFEVQKELMLSAASALTQAPLITLLTGLPQANGYVGSVPGVDLYQTDGLSTTGGDDQAAVFNPETCFAGVYSPSVQTRQVWVGSGGFWDEIASFVFSHVVEWNDTAGVEVRSDT